MNASNYSLLILLLVGVSGTLCQESSCSDADVATVQGCHKAFFAHLNLDPNPSFETYMNVSNKYIIKNGVSGAKHYRQWVLARMACLKPYEPQCTTLEAVSRIYNTKNETEIYEWFIIRPIEDWEFTEGFGGELYRNWGHLNRTIFGSAQISDA